MKHLLPILVSLLIPAFTLEAQSVPSGLTKADILAFSARIASIESDFVQVKESSLLAAPAVSSGHMTYRRPGYLVWDYREPLPFTFIADGDRVTLRRAGQDETPGGNQGRMLKEMMHVIIGHIDGSILSDEKLFKATYEQTGSGLVVTLLPQKKDIRKMWSKFVLFYEPDSMHVDKFEMHEPSGDLTTITFSNTQYGFSE